MMEPAPVTEATAPIHPPRPPVARYAIIIAALAFTALLLLLNVREADRYGTVRSPDSTEPRLGFYALSGPPAGGINASPPTWFPPGGS